MRPGAQVSHFFRNKPPLAVFLSESGFDRALPKNTMTHFPHHHLQRPANPAAKAFAAVRQNINRDILWGQPVFKAPVLPNPRIAFDPLPFTAARVTRRPPHA